jgi:pseudouridine synthase
MPALDPQRAARAAARRQHHGHPAWHEDVDGRHRRLPARDARPRVIAAQGTPRYVAFNKPYGVLSQFTPEGRWQGLGTFGLPKGIYAAGRLDADSEGLLLLTDDGRLGARMLDPKRGHKRRYLAQVEGVPTVDALAALAAGPTLGDGPTRPCLVRALDGEPALPPRDPPIRYRAAIPAAWIELTLTEGRNRQIRRMTAAVGHPTLRLVRIAIGGLVLGDLESARWRETTREEILGAGAEPAVAGRTRGDLAG